MMNRLIDNFQTVMGSGGPVMWPLLGISLLAMALTFERTWFWLRVNRPGGVARADQLARLLRQGQRAEAAKRAEHDRSPYGRIVTRLLSERVTDASAMHAVELERGRLERFMPTLSTIITGAPMVGILGTVLGIISSLHVLAADSGPVDPRRAGTGIAEALLTTAAGLTITLVVLLPYNLFRSQAARTLGRIEMLIAAAAAAQAEQDAPPTKSA